MSLEQRLRAEALKTLYAYWQGLRHGRRAPARSDLDPSDIVSVLPHIGLYDVEENPRRYRIRLLGTRIVSWYGCDLTGRYLDEIDFGESAESTFKTLNDVVDLCVPAHMTGEYVKQDERTIRFERIYLPLSSDGRKVDMVIGATVRLSPDIPISGTHLEL